MAFGEYVYQGVPLQLQGARTDWLVSCELLNRNTVVTSLVSPARLFAAPGSRFDNQNFRTIRPRCLPTCRTA